VGPDITEGWPGTEVFTVTVSVCGGPLPQVDGVTVIVPFNVPAVAVILFVFCPVFIAQVEETVQV
jgi:hypothetical protein